MRLRQWLVMVLALAGVAQASSVGTGYEVNLIGGGQYTTYNTLSYSSFSQGFTMGATQILVEGEAAASYGVLRARSRVDILSGSFDKMVDALAWFDDVWVFSGSGSGSIQLIFNVTGTMENGKANVTVWPMDDDASYQNMWTKSGILTTHNIPVVFGAPFPVEVGLAAVTYPTGTGSAYANYFSTVTLSGINVFDSLGQPVTGFTMTSESGTNYFGGGAVPEPGTFALALAAIGLLGLRLRRR